MKKKEKVKIKVFIKLQSVKENEVDMCLVFFPTELQLHAHLRKIDK